MSAVKNISRRFDWLLLGLFFCVVSVSLVHAAEVMPPKPARYFNDYAKVISPETSQRLNQTLEDFEKKTSSQILVAIFPKMQSDSSIEDYTHRIFQRWRPGQKNKDNGAVLFIFIQDRRMRIEVNYGLEGSLPDAICKRIIEDEIKPHFKNNDYDGGLTAGVNAILQATKGEYKGTGQTVNQQGTRTKQGFPFVFALICLFVLISIIRRSGAVGYNGRGRRSFGFFPFPIGGGGWSSGGGGGGFSSGGGGGGGGGGASGSW